MEKQTYKLYGFFMSSASWRVRIALNLKQLQYETIPINLTKGEQLSAEYKLINPNCSVPSLQLPNDNNNNNNNNNDNNNNNNRILCDSTAILEYLDEMHPEYPLLPVQPLDRGHVRSICQIVNSSMQPLQNLRVVKQMQQEFNKDRQEWSVFWASKGYEALEQMLQQHSGIYCYGNTISLADIYLYPQAVANASRFHYPLHQHPNVFRVVNTLRSLQPFKLSEPQYQLDYPSQ